MRKAFVPAIVMALALSSSACDRSASPSPAAPSSSSPAVDGSGRFTLASVPPGSLTLAFSGNGADARLTISSVANGEQIQITVIVNGGNADLDEHERETPDHRDEVEGRIASIDLASRTFMVRGTTVSAPAGTPIHHGATAIAFTSLAVGDRVEVHGAKSGAIVTATDVEVETEHENEPEPGEDPGHDDEGEVKGALAGKTGTCPAISFTVSATPVTTSAATQFEDTSCAGLANGDQVEVKGTKANGTIRATRVEKKGKD